MHGAKLYFIGFRNASSAIISQLGLLPSTDDAFSNRWHMGDTMVAFGPGTITQESYTVTMRLALRL